MQLQNISRHEIMPRKYPHNRPSLQILMNGVNLNKILGFTFSKNKYKINPETMENSFPEFLDTYRGRLGNDEEMPEADLAEEDVGLRQRHGFHDRVRRRVWKWMKVDEHLHFFSCQLHIVDAVAPAGSALGEVVRGQVIHGGRTLECARLEEGSLPQKH